MSDIYTIIQDEQKILNWLNILKVRHLRKKFHTKIVRFYQMAIPI